MRTRMALARQLWRTANATVPLCTNQALADTLRSIGAGFARHNPRFYAQGLTPRLRYAVACGGLKGVFPGSQRPV